MRPVPVVILLPSCHRVAGVSQCAKQRFIETFVSSLAVEAFDEAVLLTSDNMNCPPRLPHSQREFAGLSFIFRGFVLGERVVREALKLLKRSTRFSGCLVLQ